MPTTSLLSLLETAVIITNNRTLNALDALFNAAELIAHYDYVAVGNRIINWLVIATAIIIGTTDYVVTAVRLYWDDYGAIIITNGNRFIINLVDYSHELFVFGQDCRRFVTKTANHLADSAFFAITA